MLLGGRELERDLLRELRLALGRALAHRREQRAELVGVADWIGGTLPFQSLTHHREHDQLLA